MRRLTAVLALLAALPAAAETVTGTLTWAEPTALPPEAVLEVAVEDISRADAPSIRLAGFTVSPVGTPPLGFSIDVPAPDPQATVSVRASVRVGDELLLTTDTVAPVLTRDAGTRADLTLIHVGAPSPAALTGIDWRITSIGGAPVPAEARDPVLNFKTTADGAAFAASAGCNRFVGQAIIAGDKLTFGPAAATRMACPPPLDAAESALSAALGATARWQIDGATLRLLDAGDTVLLEASAP